MKKIFWYFLLFITLISLVFVYINQNNITSQSSTNLLTKIEDYQKQYWEIIKKHNMFTQIAEIDNSIKQDQADLEKLYQNVQNQISKNNKYFAKLDDIEEKYNTEIKKAETQTEINIISGEYLENTDKILNEVYQEIKKSSKPDDFEELKSSEIKWIKDLEEYQKFIENQEFGSILGFIYGKTTQNIKYFRTLLLIFYLEQNN